MRSAGWPAAAARRQPATSSRSMGGCLMRSSGDHDLIAAALDRLSIELPSWGFANTGTRFGKYLQPAAAVTTEEKISDAAHVHALTGSRPTVALHVLRDFPLGLDDCDAVR